MGVKMGQHPLLHFVRSAKLSADALHNCGPVFFLTHSHILLNIHAICMRVTFDLSHCLISFLCNIWGIATKRNRNGRGLVW